MRRTELVEVGKRTRPEAPIEFCQWLAQHSKYVRCCDRTVLSNREAAAGHSEGVVVRVEAVHTGRIVADRIEVDHTVEIAGMADTAGVAVVGKEVVDMIASEMLQYVSDSSEH